MIQEAIMSKCSSVMKTYPLIGDIEATVPFCCYACEQRPVFEKRGIAWYETVVNISVVDAVFKDCLTKSATIIGNIEALAGTTQNSTVVKMVMLTKEAQRYDEAGAYVNEIQFRIVSDNK